MLRKTKIICTIGPASEDSEVLERLLAEGMDAARINFSHGTRRQNLRMYEAIRSAASKVDKALPIIGDLQGGRHGSDNFRCAAARPGPDKHDAGGED